MISLQNALCQEVLAFFVIILFYAEELTPTESTFSSIKRLFVYKCFIEAVCQREI